MAVKIRLARRGRRKRVTFDVVVADARAPRDGRFIEKIGLYNPLTNPASVEIKEDRAFHWLMNGAQPSYTVKAMLSYRGIMLKKHLQIGVLKGALTQEQADAKLAEWQKSKQDKIEAKRDKIAKSRQEVAKSKKEAERKVKEARAEIIRKKELAETATADTTEPSENTEKKQSLESVNATEGKSDNIKNTDAPKDKKAIPESTNTPGEKTDDTEDSAKEA